MALKYIEQENVWVASYSKRHPITKRAVTLRRKFKTKVEAAKNISKLVILVEERLKQSIHKTWDQLIDDWRKAALSKNIFAAQLSERAVADYDELLRLYTSCWLNRFVDEVTRTEVWMLLNKVENTVSKSRAKKLRTAIDGVFNWAVLSGKIPKIESLPTQGYRWSTKTEEKLPEILSRDEICQFLSYAKKLNSTWYPIWAMAIYTGMRSGELYALRWKSVDLDRRVLFVHEGWTNKTGFGPTKGRYWRAVPIEGQEVITLLKGLKLQSRGSEFVLPRLQSWTDGRQAELLREFLANMGLPSIRFHALRACFATQLLRDSVAPAVIMKICGWQDLKTMQHYIRLSGIDVKGATESLKFLSEAEAMGRVVELVRK